MSALDALPHGPEFRFLDSVETLEPGVSLVGTVRPKPDAAYFAGHFPGQPIFPGVLMIEAIAQAAGVAAQCDPGLPPLSNLRLTAVRQVKIFGTEPAGSVLRVEAEVSARMGGLIQAVGRVRAADGRILAEGGVTLAGE